jgi:hypothetical protein
VGDELSMQPGEGGDRYRFVVRHLREVGPDKRSFGPPNLHEPRGPPRPAVHFPFKTCHRQ